MARPSPLAQLALSRPPAGLITAAEAYRLRAVTFEAPTLMVVVSGSKRVGRPPAEVACGEGEFLMVHTAGRRDVENVPSARAPYRAWAIPFPWSIVDVARALLLPRVQPAGPSATTGGAGILERPLRALLAAPEADPVERELALLGVLAILARHGQTRFLDARDPSFVARVRSVVAAEPARPWPSAALERRLAVSGATLRRRLAAAGTTLRDVVRDTRLQHGLGLLQTSRLPVKAVAYASGYRSVTSFSRNFRARYGVPVTAVSSWRDESSA